MLRSQDMMIHGWVAEGFEGVQSEFVRNFSERGELGAACAIYHRGKKVVDLWGGYRDHTTQALWEEDTLVLVFSTTKGLASMAMAAAHSRKLFDLDTPVVTYWPEFGQQSKEHITVRQLLSHQAGLCAIDEPLNPQKMANLDGIAAVIARQKPAWEPGTRHGYHGLSLGFYEGELLRRIDPQHRSLGQFFQEEIASPLGLEFYIGLPATVPDTRVAAIKAFHPLEMVLHMHTMPRGMVLAYMIPGSLTARTFSNPKVRSPGDFNRPKFRMVEFPAGGGIGQVRSIAKAYSVFATGGHELGITDETLTAITTPASPPSKGTRDEVLKVDTAYAFGFMKPFPAFQFGTGDRAFGTVGAGGSFGFADPDRQVGFAYAMTRMGFHIWDDPREKALRDAFYTCLQDVDVQP